MTFRSLPQRGTDLSRTTHSLATSEVSRKWLLIDAEDLILGRLASLAANYLRGKHKPQYTPHVDCGDAVVIVNAGRIHLTGNKLEEKVYYRHSRHAGGLKKTVAKTILGSAYPERVIESAVRRMVGSGPLAKQQLGHLYVYGGPTHPHDGQKPRFVDVAALNAKNRKGGFMSGSNFVGQVEGVVKKVVDQAIAPLITSDKNTAATLAALKDEFADNARRTAANQEATNTTLTHLSDNQTETNGRLSKVEETLESIQANTATTTDLLRQILEKISPGATSTKP